MSANAPRTTKEALIAEMLGDLDQIMTRVEQATASLEKLRPSMEQRFEESASAAARDLDAATARFGEVTTRSVDDFVMVANEALSKFVERTNEIKGALDALPATRRPSALSGAESSEEKKQPPSAVLWWLLPTVFGTGVVLGVAVSVWLLK